jgi:hypothetical protein
LTQDRHIPSYVYNRTQEGIVSNVIALNENHVIIGDDFWVDAATGDWATDCQIGRQRAEELVTQMRDRPDLHPRFTRSMGTLVERGQFTGVEVGFFQCLLELATANRDP